MEDQNREQLSKLLHHGRVAALAVAIDGVPFASQVPFAMTEDLGAALIHVSGLARHSEGLTSGALYSLLIGEPDCRAETNPAQLARVTLSGWVEALERQSAPWEEARDRYLAKFPKSAITFQLGDFNLHALRVDGCRFVAGFGKAFDVTTDELAELA
jgi:putative heme iron utilization protein